MGNDTLCVDGDVRTLDDIEASHADEWYGDDVLVRALIAEVRRLRAVEAAADTTVRNPERHFMECAALAHTVTVGDADTCVPFDVVRCDCFLGDLVDALAAAPDTEGGTDAR